MALLAGCGGEKKQTTTTTVPTKATAVRVCFLRDGKVQPVRRVVSVPRDLGGSQGPIADAALRALVEGPSESERELGLSSEVPEDFTWGQAGEAAHGWMAIGGNQKLSRSALAQVVYTLAQFDRSQGSPSAGVNEQLYSRGDFEDETPAILVESPLPFQTVTSPLRVRGTANTFEATFQYDLVGPDGKLLKTHFVTATSGSGTRGTFAFTVSYEVDRTGLGELVVYERSAENGSRIHVVEIPIRLTP